jgi:pilus assembly protein CpaF
VHSQVAAALHVVVHLVRGPGGVRRVGEVAVLSVGRDGRVSSMPALTHGPGGAATPGPGADRLAELLERVSP